MEKLNYLNEKVSLNFNLREPRKVTGTTNVYAVIKVQGKQIKVSINAKVNPWQWDSRKQTPRINNNMTEQDLQNALQINSIINDVRMTFYSYLCSSEEITESGITETIKKHLTFTDMANKNAVPPGRTVTATKLLNEAFTRRYGTKENPKVAAKSYYLYSRHLQYFINYLSQPNVYDSVNALTAKGMFNYHEYMNTKANASANVINQCCNTIILLVNDISVNPNYNKYGLKKIEPFKKKSMIKKAEKAKRAITNEEIKALNELDLSNNEKLSTYRDLFNMQLNSGVRVYDLPKLFNHEYKVTKEDNQEMQTIISHKETITAVIIVNETIKNLQTKYANGLPFTLNESTYNKAIKKLFEMANCTYTEKHTIEKHGVKQEVNERFCDKVTNHYARHTFITNMLRKGWSFEKVAYLTGHANDIQIREIYAHLTETDKANQVIKELRKIENESKANETNTNAVQMIEIGKELQVNELIKEYKDILIFLGGKKEDVENINDLDTLLHLVRFDYYLPFYNLGIDEKEIKDLYNKNATMEEKQRALRVLKMEYEEKRNIVTSE